MSRQHRAHDEVVAAFGKAAASVRRVRSAQRAACAVAVCAVGFATGVWWDALAPMTPWGLGIWAGTLCVGAVGLGWRLGPGAAFGEVHAAKLYEARRGVQDGVVVAGVQLAMDAARKDKYDERETVGAKLATHAVQGMAWHAQYAQKHARETGRRKRAWCAAAMAVAAVGGAAAVPDAARAHLARLVSPAAPPAPYAPAVLLVDTGCDMPDGPLVGDDVWVVVRVSLERPAWLAWLWPGAEPSEVALEVSTDRATRRITMQPTKKNNETVFTAVLGGLRERAVVRAVAEGGIRNAEAVIDPEKRPRIVGAAAVVVASDGRVRQVPMGKNAVVARVGDAVEVVAHTTIQLGTKDALGQGGGEVTVRGATAVRTRWLGAPGEVRVSVRPVGPTGLESFDEAGVLVRVVGEAEAEADTDHRAADAENTGATAGAAAGGDAVGATDRPASEEDNATSARRQGGAQTTAGQTPGGNAQAGEQTRANQTPKTPDQRQARGSAATSEKGNDPGQAQGEGRALAGAARGGAGGESAVAKGDVRAGRGRDGETEPTSGGRGAVDHAQQAPKAHREAVRRYIQRRAVLDTTRKNNGGEQQ